MPTSDPGTKSRIFDSLPSRVQSVLVAYVDEAKIPLDAVIEFAITHFLELEPVPLDDRQSHAEDGSILADLPASLRSEIKDYAESNEIPPEFVVELALVHFLAPDSVTFDDCQVGVQRERVELLKLHHDTRQATAA